MSPAAANLTHLRLRVPSRDLAYVLIGPQTAHRETRNLFPSLRYLDISTTNVRLDSVLSTLLRSYSRLEHLVLDHVNLFGFTAKEKGAELCKSLGGVCVSAGLARGKERERSITAWDSLHRASLAQLQASRSRSLTVERSSDNEDGTEGSEIEERIAARQQAEEAERENERQVAFARARRGHRSAGHSTFSLRDRPSRARTTASSSSNVPSFPVPPSDKLYLVLPPLPTLKTVSIGGEAHHLGQAKVIEWDNEFQAGWREGLSKVLGWAIHVADRYDRGKRKANDWCLQERKQSQEINKSAVKGNPGLIGPSTGSKPPCDVRLFRFPLPEERHCKNDDDPFDPTLELMEIHPDNREYLEPYKIAIADAELHANNHSIPPPCILCTIPDCEGPARRGAEGEKVDGRGGMSGVHKAGCGHLIGRKAWGWEAI